MSKRNALPDAEPVIADFTQGPVKDLLGACDQCADLLLTVRARGVRRHWVLLVLRPVYGSGR